MTKKYKTSNLVGIVLERLNKALQGAPQSPHSVMRKASPLKKWMEKACKSAKLKEELGKKEILVPKDKSGQKPFKPGKFSASHANEYRFKVRHEDLTVTGKKHSGSTGYEPHEVHFGNGFKREQYEEPLFHVVHRKYMEGTPHEQPIHFVYKMNQDFPKK